MALRTPDRLCNCLGPVKLRPARVQGIELLIGGEQFIPGACVPRASVEFSIT